MTREEEAIERLKTDIYKYADFTENPNENEFWMAFEMAIKALEQQTCEDAVSREAVLDVIDDIDKTTCMNEYHVIVDAIDKLPSVNPAKKQELCEDAVSRAAVLDIFADNADATRPYSTAWEKIRDLPSVNPQPKWIPVSESLPKGSDIVLLSLPPHIDPDGEECSASVICGHYIGGKYKEWGLSDGDTFGYGLVSIRKGTNPIAWMPLPQPYELQESEE